MLALKEAFRSSCSFLSSSSVNSTDYEAKLSFGLRAAALSFREDFLDYDLFVLCVSVSYLSDFSEICF